MINHLIPNNIIKQPAKGLSRIKITQVSNVQKL